MLYAVFKLREIVEYWLKYRLNVLSSENVTDAVFALLITAKRR